MKGKELTIAIQAPNQGLALTDVEQLLYTVSSGDTARLERALFGQSVADIGLHPDVLVVNQIQDEVIKAVFELVTSAVKEGRREQVAGSVQYLLTEIGEKVVVVLAQAKQYHQSSRRTLEQGRKWWQLLPGQVARRHKADVARIGSVTDTISSCRADLMSALYESFVPEIDGKDADELRNFILLRDRLVSLHKLVVPGKSEDYPSMYARVIEVDTAVFGMLCTQGALFNFLDSYKNIIHEFKAAAIRADSTTLAHKHLRCLFEALDNHLYLLLKEYDEKVEEHLGPKVRAYLKNTGTADSR